MIKGIMKLFGGDESAGNQASDAESNGEFRDLENFVDYVVRALVDHPEDVSVAAGIEENNNVIRIDCRKEDIGKVVGKKGKTIMAIRSLVSGAAGRLQQRVSVEIND